jgi:hypothetical protein
MWRFCAASSTTAVTDRPWIYWAIEFVRVMIMATLVVLFVVVNQALFDIKQALYVHSTSFGHQTLIERHEKDVAELKEFCER